MFAGSLVEASQWSSSAAQRCRLQAEHTLREVHAALFEVEEELLVPGCSSAAAQGTGEQRGRSVLPPHGPPQGALGQTLAGTGCD